MTIKKENLDFWASNGYNVLFVGKAGTGKTTIVTDFFTSKNYKWKYFSASTLDPWVDLVGVPKEKTDSNGVSYIDLVRPKDFAYDEVEAIFFDEYNRAPKKVRNAVMELIQFKSINGKVFKNLKVIWAAINPYDEDQTYDVEKLDPAQIDRFHIHVDVPYLPDREYLTTKYGTAVAEASFEWWKGLPDKVKDKVSPRRLDYALDIFGKNGDIRMVLPMESSPSKLINDINFGDVQKHLAALKDPSALKQFLSQPNNRDKAINLIMTDNTYRDVCIKHLPDEAVSKLISSVSLYKDIIKIAEHDPKTQNVLVQAINANSLKPAVMSKVKKLIGPNTRNALSGKATFVGPPDWVAKGFSFPQYVSDDAKAYQALASNEYNDTTNRNDCIMNFITKLNTKMTYMDVVNATTDLCHLLAFIKDEELEPRGQCMYLIQAFNLLGVLFCRESMLSIDEFYRWLGNKLASKVHGKITILKNKGLLVC